MPRKGRWAVGSSGQPCLTPILRRYVLASLTMPGRSSRPAVRRQRRVNSGAHCNPSIAHWRRSNAASVSNWYGEPPGNRSRLKPDQRSIGVLNRRLPRSTKHQVGVMISVRLQLQLTTQEITMPYDAEASGRRCGAAVSRSPDEMPGRVLAARAMFVWPGRELPGGTTHHAERCRPKEAVALVIFLYRNYSRAGWTSHGRRRLTHGAK